MKKFFIGWIEEYLFFPTPFQRVVGILFLPFTVLYCVVMAYLRISKNPIDFGIPVVSVGNLLVGGTGKTPVIIALAKARDKVAVLLRGYGRDSKGLVVVSNKGKLLENDVAKIGDEAMLLAKSLPNATVIVSEDRKQGIVKAKEIGCQIVFLDDGYRHHDIVKFDILLRPKKEPTNIFCLPSGGYRDTKMMYSFADLVLVEGKDFHRVVSFSCENQRVETLPENLVLITAISKANRLMEYLPSSTKTEIFEDHHFFTQEEINKILQKYAQSSFITTRKDFVKLETFGLQNLYIMELEVQIEKEKLEKVEKYLQK